MDAYELSKKNTKRYRKIKHLLKLIYGFEGFKPKQYEIINKVVNGEDVCAILPTGYGKSLTFQIPALYLDKPAIIISPLISLMDDQRLILNDLGISSCCYNSNVINKSRMKTEILQGKYKFIYITPESITNMQEFFEQLEDKQGISLIAIDEAHCISSYGFDFRKAYRELTFFKQVLPQIPILAVTATATKVVGKDICKVLGLKTDGPIQTSFDRKNLYLEVQQKGDIGSDIVPIIQKYTNSSIIIYCLTRKETAKIQNILKIHKIKCGIYHAGLSADEKEETHHQFIRGKIKIIVATVAFGMGINKSDVRVVIHYGSPKNIEGYYQEIGRAGRDGEKAYCYAFYSQRDFKIQEAFIANSSDPAYQKTQYKLLEQMRRYMTTKQCRRSVLLEYFDEDSPEKCDFCDICCDVHKNDKKILTTQQNVDKEAKMLIKLIESFGVKGFGMCMYIDILRGSGNKKITSAMKKNKYFGAGKHKSVAWWKEMSDKLIEKKYLQQIFLRGGKFGMQITKATHQGLSWANGLEGILENIGNSKLGPIEMSYTV